ncbi:MAG: ABC transporter permease, partial [Thermoguttaceae bacterium]
VPLLHAGHGIARAHRGRASGPPWLRGGLAALPPAARRASAPHAADDGPPVAADDTGPPSPDGSRTGAPLADGPLADGPRPGFGPRRGAGRRRPPAGYRPRGPLFPATLRTSFRSLRRNKLRSALTALGVIIGVAAVIAMTEIGEGSRNAIQRTIASMGANNLLILPGAAMSGSVSFGTGSAQTLRPADMDEILRQCSAVSAAAPIVWCHPQVIYGNRNWIPMNTSGTTPAYLVVRDREEMEEGDCFTEADVRNAGKVCLIGTTLRDELFPDESPIGKEIRVQNVPFRIVGVLGRKGASMTGQDQDDVLLAPWTTIKFRVNGSGAGNLTQTTAAQSAAATINSLDTLYPGGAPLYPLPTPIEAADMPQSARTVNLDLLVAKAASGEQIPEAIDQITGLLRERHRLPPDRDNDFEIRDLSEVRKTMASTSELMKVRLLVVGGVGIMNIMLVSVTERTREIGLRMAVGARSHHILRQFLLEAVLLCLVGGAVGILLGRSASVLVHSVLGWPTQTSLLAIVIAVMVSAGVGIIFGFYPAWKASRLDPIEALRYE